MRNSWFPATLFPPFFPPYIVQVIEIHHQRIIMGRQYCWSRVAMVALAEHACGGRRDFYLFIYTFQRPFLLPPPPPPDGNIALDWIPCSLSIPTRGGSDDDDDDDDGIGSSCEFPFQSTEPPTAFIHLFSATFFTTPSYTQTTGVHCSTFPPTPWVHIRKRTNAV